MKYCVAPARLYTDGHAWQDKTIHYRSDYLTGIRRDALCGVATPTFNKQCVTQWWGPSRQRANCQRCIDAFTLGVLNDIYYPRRKA